MHRQWRRAQVGMMRGAMLLDQLQIYFRPYTRGCKRWQKARQTQLSHGGSCRGTPGLHGACCTMQASHILDGCQVHGSRNSVMTRHTTYNLHIHGVTAVTGAAEAERQLRTMTAQRRGGGGWLRALVAQGSLTALTQRSSPAQHVLQLAQRLNMFLEDTKEPRHAGLIKASASITTSGPGHAAARAQSTRGSQRVQPALQASW